MRESAVLEVNRVVKRFDGVTAVDGLSFHIDRGEIVGLLGINGAGKTTAMNMILGLTAPTSGEITVFGKSLRKHRIAILQRANFSSAYTSLPSNLRVWQNLMVFARIYGVPSPMKKIDELLALLEIGYVKNRVTGRLSSGESTRVNLCKALLNDPELLMLDEPTASLDPDIADKVRRIVRRVQKETGMAVLYTSHNMRDVEEVCDRIVFIHHGRVIAQGTPDDVMRHFDESSLEKVFIKVARDGEVRSL